MKDEIAEIWNFVTSNGELVNKAQSAWGADRWRYLDGDEWLIATLEDDGYTKMVSCDSVMVRRTHGRAMDFTRGGADELSVLHSRISDLKQKTRAN